MPRPFRGTPADDLAGRIVLGAETCLDSGLLLHRTSEEDVTVRRSLGRPTRTRRGRRTGTEETGSPWGPRDSQAADVAPISPGRPGGDPGGCRPALHVDGKL